MIRLKQGRSMITLTREQCQLVDKLAAEKLGIPGIILMENASRNAADVIESLITQWTGRADTPRRISILCGGGNNGGDGYAIARHLHNRGHSVRIIALKPVEQLSGDAAVNAGIIKRMALDFRLVESNEDVSTVADALSSSDVLVDAMLGTGFSGQVREPMSSVIEQINESGVPIVAIDVPSGLNCNTGKPSNATVRARATVTFVACKVGFTTEEAHAFVGDLYVRDIGAPPSLIGDVMHY